MMTGSQRWDYGTWMLNAIADRNKIQRRASTSREPNPNDIFKYDIRSSKREGDCKVYNRKNGKVLFEAESYDEARRVLEERFSGA